MRRIVAIVALALSAAVLLAGCASRVTGFGADAPAVAQSAADQPPSADPDAPARHEPAVTISDRDGPSWSGRLGDGVYSEDGVTGLGAGRGPDPARVGRSSVGWLYQWADEGFRPTEVIMPIGAWQARWSPAD